MFSKIISFIEGLFKLSKNLVPVSVSSTWNPSTGIIAITLTYSNIPAIEADVLDVFLGILKGIENVVSASVQGNNIVISAKI